MTALKLIDQETISNQKYKLETVTYEQPGQDEHPQEKKAEVYFRPDGCSILLINIEEQLIILTEQYRISTYLNGNAEGKIIEACAGIIDEGELPEQCIVREVEEETGYRISEIKKIFEAYSSPGGLTELIHFFIGMYSKEMKISAGGGKTNEQENIKVLELPFGKARNMVDKGEIRDCKTIMLLQYAIIHNLI